MRIFLYLLFAATLASCTYKTDRKQTGIFNFDSLIENQAVLLAKDQFKLVKSSTINDKTDSISFVPDVQALRTELEIFKQLNAVNNPTIVGLYTKSDNERDARSNLIVRSFQANQNTLISSIRFYYRPDSNHLMKIEAEASSTNKLFNSKRFFVLEFDEINGLEMLTSYHVYGTQKMALHDQVNYSINAFLLK